MERNELLKLSEDASHHRVAYVLENTRNCKTYSIVSNDLNIVHTITNIFSPTVKILLQKNNSVDDTIIAGDFGREIVRKSIPLLHTLSSLLLTYLFIGLWYITYIPRKTGTLQKNNGIESKADNYCILVDAMVLLAQSRNTSIQKRINDLSETKRPFAGLQFSSR